MADQTTLDLILDLLKEDRDATKSLERTVSVAERKNDERDRSVQALAESIHTLKAAWDADAPNRDWVAEQLKTEQQSEEGRKSLRTSIATARRTALANAPLASITAAFSGGGTLALATLVQHLKGH